MEEARLIAVDTCSNEERGELVVGKGGTFYMDQVVSPTVSFSLI